jgi:hypothetical protein
MEERERYSILLFCPGHNTRPITNNYLSESKTWYIIWIIHFFLFTGMKQGYLQSKLALIKVLQKYEISLDNKTDVPMKFKTSCLVPQSLKGVWIKLRKLDDTKCD